MQIHDANLKHNGNWSYRSGTSEIILHHAEASHASVEDINQWHLERDWAGIGYNYYVRKDGTIWRGSRSGRLALTRSGTMTSPSASAARARI